MNWVGIFLSLIVVGFTIDSIFEKYFNHKIRLRQMELGEVRDKEGRELRRHQP